MNGSPAFGLRLGLPVERRDMKDEGMIARFRATKVAIFGQLQ
jgi:hypothetical protein